MIFQNRCRHSSQRYGLIKRKLNALSIGFIRCDGWTALLSQYGQKIGRLFFVGAFSCCTVIGLALLPGRSLTLRFPFGPDDDLVIVSSLILIDSQRESSALISLMISDLSRFSLRPSTIWRASLPISRLSDARWSARRGPFSGFF